MEEVAPDHMVRVGAAEGWVLGQVLDGDSTCAVSVPVGTGVRQAWWWGVVLGGVFRSLDVASVGEEVGLDLVKLPAWVGV